MTFDASMPHAHSSLAPARAISPNQHIIEKISTDFQFHINKTYAQAAIKK